MNIKWIEPESRLIINKIFGRDFDSFTEGAQQTVNWSVLIGDIAAVLFLFSLL